MTGDQAPVLVTGATGFLGSWIIADLLRANRPVVAVDIKRDHGRLRALMDEIPAGLLETCVCDVTDTAAVDRLIAEKQPSSIIHLAALMIPACAADPVAGAMVNIIGHINIFEAARRNDIAHVVYTSSIAAKPRGPEKAPSNLYGVFKKTGEEIARLYWRDHGIASLGLRPYIVYGVGRDDGETSAITKAIRAAALGESYTLPFWTRSCFQYAGEVAEIFSRAARADWQGALLSDLTSQVSSTDDLFQAIRLVVPDARVSGTKSVRVSPSEGFETASLREVIGDWPATPLIDGVRQTVELYRRNDSTAGDSRR